VLQVMQGLESPEFFERVGKHGASEIAFFATTFQKAGSVIKLPSAAHNLSRPALTAMQTCLTLL
jgi:hypothetical protein